MSEIVQHEDPERTADIYRLRVVNRWTMKEIAEKHGISIQRVSQIIQEYRATLPPMDVEKIRQEALDLYEDMQKRLLALAELEGAPVTSGKDGGIVYDPETQSVVRDYAGRIAALRAALDVDKERRKLTGADAATKVETTATVKWEVVGVDTETLT